MPKILTTTTDGLPAEPVEDAEVQRLIERVDDARESLHKSLHSIYDRELVIYREHDGRDDEGPRVRCVADVSLCNLNLRKGTEAELLDEIKDELCAMFGLRRK